MKLYIIIVYMCDEKKNKKLKKKKTKENPLFPKANQLPCPNGHSICQCHPELRRTKKVAPQR
jgi:hypothetical protein